MSLLSRVDKINQLHWWWQPSSKNKHQKHTQIHRKLIIKHKPNL